MLVDDLGWLMEEGGDPKVVRYTTTRTTSLETPKPLGIVWHWTAGRCGPGWAKGCCDEIVTYNPAKDRAASWHILIAKNGDLHQCAPFIVGTWHVGKGGLIGSHQSVNVNRCTVGVEIENAGRLIKLGMKAYCWPFWLNPDDNYDRRRPDPGLEVNPQRAAEGKGGFWKDAEGGLFDAYTPEQIRSATILLTTLVKLYGWDRSVCGYGHLMFDYPRKEDPGPLWLLDALPGILDATFQTAQGERGEVCEAPDPSPCPPGDSTV
jgi:hypothetical protein